MDLAEMYTEVRDRLGEDQPNFWSDAHIYRRLNEAAQTFSHEQRWKWLLMRCTFVLEQGESEIQLIDDVDFTRQFDLSLNPYTWVDPDWVAPTNDNAMVVPQKQPEAYLMNLRANTTNMTGSPRWYSLDHRLVINYYAMPGPSDNALGYRGSDTCLP